MSVVELTAGTASLGAWRRVWMGEAARLAPEARERISAGAAALGAILARGEAVYGLNTGFGRLASVRIPEADLAALQRNLVLSHAAGVGPPTPAAIVRLMMALKLASLAKGASGVRLEVTDLVEAMLARGLLPVIPQKGSVGASGDLAPLAHLACALIGEGQIETGGETLPAAAALAGAGFAPLQLGPKEGLALLNGTQFSTAWALAGLFRAEDLWRAALICGALSTEAAKGADTPFDHRIHALRGHAGQIEAAGALRALMAGSAIRESHRQGDLRVQDPYSLRCQPQVMGAALSLLRYAAGVLKTEASGVTDNPIILAETEEALSGGNFHAEPVAFAADALAMALCEVGSLAERRVAVLIDPALSGLPAFLTPTPGLHSGFMLAQVTAAALVAENRSQAFPASVDSIPTSAGQEDHVAMSAHAARRLARLADNLEPILAIELLAACQGCDFHAPFTSSPALERVRARVRSEVAPLGADRALAPDIAAAGRLIAGGAMAEAAGLDLPGIG